MNKLGSILDKHIQLVPAFFSPAVRLRSSSLIQRCITHSEECIEQIAKDLQQITRSIVNEVMEIVYPMKFEEERPSSYEPLLNTIVSSSTFLSSLLTSNCHVIFVILMELCSICESIDKIVLHVLAHLFLLLHLSFTSTIHFRKIAIQSRFTQDSINVLHTQLLERVIRVSTCLLSRITNSTARAVAVNFISELMYSFVSKWKELYHSNDVLMNANINAVSGIGKIMSLYGDNVAQVHYYLPNYISFEAFHKLMQFLYAMTYYNNYRNPLAFSGTADFIAICIFERIFGIAYMQRHVERTKEDVNWRELVPIPPECKCSLDHDDWIEKNEVTLIELPYTIVDSMKSSGKTEYYKSIGKTRLVFMMVSLHSIE